MLTEIAEFAEFEHTSLDLITDTLDRSVCDKWKGLLNDQEQGMAASVLQHFPQEVQLIQDRLPGPLFAS